MKYSILGFNQEKIVAYNKDGLMCDLTDLLLLNYIVYAQSNSTMKHIMDENNQPCVWLQHEHILNDLPILNITDGTLKNRLTKLRKMELITSKTVANENTQGSRTYYRTTSLLYDMLFETTSLKNDVIEEPRHSKMTSNIQVNNNKKEKSNSKELLQNFEFGKPKEKKPNLYSKCIAMIDEYTENPDIRKLLVQYLNLRLEMKDKPIYANQWKGLLNKLSQCINEGNSTAEDIIKQSIEKGYATFYPITNKRSTKEKPWEQGVTSERFTKEDDRAMREFLEKMKKEGRRTEF